MYILDKRAFAYRQMKIRNHILIINIHIYLKMLITKNKKINIPITVMQNK